MSKFVISVVSDISDSSTYGIFDTEEEAEKVLEQLPEHMYEGDYFFNIHEIQTKDDFLNNYSENDNYSDVVDEADDESEVDEDFEDGIVNEYNYPLVSPEEWNRDKEFNQNKLFDFIFKKASEYDTTWRSFTFSGRSKEEFLDYINELKNHGTELEKEEFYNKYKSFGIKSIGYGFEFNNEEDKSNLDMLSLFKQWNNKALMKTLDEIFADDENVSESDFDEHYERKYLRAQYSYVMLNNVMNIPEDGSFRSDEQIGKVSRKMVKEFRKDYQNKVRELVEEKEIPLDQLFNEEFLY